MREYAIIEAWGGIWPEDGDIRPIDGDIHPEQWIGDGGELVGISAPSLIGSQ